MRPTQLRTTTFPRKRTTSGLLALGFMVATASLSIGDLAYGQGLNWQRHSDAVTDDVASRPRLTVDPAVQPASAEQELRTVPRRSTTQRGGRGLRSTVPVQRVSRAPVAKRPTSQQAVRTRPSATHPSGQVAYAGQQESQQLARTAQNKRVRTAQHTKIRTAQHEEQSEVIAPGKRAPTSVVESIAPPQVSGPMMHSYDGEYVDDGYVSGGCACGQCEGPSCGCADPGCAFEPGCGFEGPTCGIGGCGDCACGDVGCCGECVGPTCGCGVAGCLGGCADRGAVPLVLYVPPIKDVVFFGGVHAFKNPLDVDDAGNARDGGNFGIHEGVNIGGKMAWLPFTGLGYQLGYQAVHSQFSGDSTAATDDTLTQQFFTGGLFRRRPVGLQYGVVYDLLRDERQGSIDFSQIRGQISVTNPRGGEVGFLFTSHTNEETLASGTTYQGLDQYLLFYRLRGKSGGEFSGFIGGSDRSKTILGGELYAPLTDWWSIQTNFTYAIPDDGGASRALAGSSSLEEHWNLGINLVWHYGGTARRWYKSPWRPMFSVADNGSFMVDDVD